MMPNWSMDDVYFPPGKSRETRLVEYKIKENKMNSGGVVAFILVCVILAIGSIGGCMAWMPQYNVYQQEMEGKAELAKADQNRQIAVAVAKAKAESAELEAKAEVARATGAAQANKILIETLGGPENYLRWRYIMMLEDNKGSVQREVIYTPSGGTFPLPITEAGRAVGQVPSAAEINQKLQGGK